MLQAEKNRTKLMDINEVADFLEISSATVRNWIKHDYIAPARAEGKMRFIFQDVHSLKENLLNGNINRLRKRANKNKSSSTFLPIEYLTDSEKLKDAENVVNIIHTHNVEVEEGLFFLALKILVDDGLIKPIENIDTLLSFDDNFFNHRQIKKEIQAWAKKVKFKSKEDFQKKIMSVHVPHVRDFLGVIYQALSKEGNKAEAGSYYTPPSIAEGIVKEYLPEQCKRVLDPCCGTGQFLLFAVDILSQLGNKRVLENVWGCDIDELAVRIARLNLLLNCKDQEEISPHVYCLNSIIEGCDIFSSYQSILKENFFDLIITNPPWGAKIAKSEINQLSSLFPFIKSGEAFSYFLAKGTRLLKKEGVLSYILPESFLNVKMHGDIREYLLKNYTLKKILFLDRVFKNVFTPVIRFDIQKTQFPRNHKIEVQNGKTFKIAQDELLKNENFEISITIDNEDAHILKKIFSQKHTTLANNAEWALGIVTGNNDKFLSEDKKEGHEGIIKGKDIMKFIYRPAQCFLKFEPAQFQQTAPEQKYRSKEKLIYRFISKQLVFAYDDKQILTLNSANILIPQSSTHSIKVILGLFNSSLYQFIFHKKFNSIKVLRNHIESLPLPGWSEAIYKNIVSFVDRLICFSLDQEDRICIFNELDKYIMFQWGLTENEIQHVLKNVSNIKIKGSQWKNLRKN